MLEALRLVDALRSDMSFEVSLISPTISGSFGSNMFVVFDLNVEVHLNHEAHWTCLSSPVSVSTLSGLGSGLGVFHLERQSLRN